MDKSLKNIEKVSKNFIEELKKENINKEVKAVIFKLNEKSYVLENSNFNLRKKLPDFSKAKKEAGLNDGQIVFAGFELAKNLGEKYINKYNQIVNF